MQYTHLLQFTANAMNVKESGYAELINVSLGHKCYHNNNHILIRESMNDKLTLLRGYMKNQGIDFYVFPNTDPHISEYVGEYYRIVKYLSGFTGSNATILLTMTDANLWTDGRYFGQAQRELDGSGIELKRIGVEKEPTIEDYIRDYTEKNGLVSPVIGYDSSLITKNRNDEYKKLAKELGGYVKHTEDIVDEIWDERPAKSAGKIYALDEKYAGKSTFEKVKEIRDKIKQKSADALISNELCDIAWLFNLRGDDIEHVPVFYSYMYLDERYLCLFVDTESLPRTVVKYLKGIEGSEVKIYPIGEIDKRLSKVRRKSILADPAQVNMNLCNLISEKNELIYEESPIKLLKATKNKTEIDNTKKAHLSDSLAVTKMIYGLKNGEYQKDLTELKVSEIIRSLRKQTDDFIEDSFTTIAAYGANAAMMHYAPSEANPVEIEPKGFLLIDSGGHYLTGTTDVTRTIAMGRLTKREKSFYTRVLKAHLNLMDAKFKKGTSGLTLDMLSRQFFWREGLDYLSGTGHGVGHLLSVHEGPNNIGWRSVGKAAAIEEGMITTDEPGYYEDGSFGIRIENELLCVPYMESEYGKFLQFEPLTLVPYERDAILYEELTEVEKDIFNQYNERVYNSLSPYLDDKECKWLKKVTKAIE